MDEPTDDTPPPARLRTRVVPQGELPLAAQHRRLERLAAATSPHLPRVVGVREEERRFVVQTAEIPGAPLTAIKEARGGLTAPEAWRVLADVCSALAALHAAGVIHGGVAPHRSRVRARAGRGRAVLRAAGTVERQDAGTAGFRAPETAAGAAAGAPGDVWAAARVAVWVVGHAHRQALGEHLRPLLLANPEARPSAAAAARIAEKHAAPRVDLPDEARLAAAHLRAQAASPPVPLARPRRPRVRRWAAAGVALAVAAGAYGLAEMR